MDDPALTGVKVAFYSMPAIEIHRAEVVDSCGIGSANHEHFICRVWLDGPVVIFGLYEYVISEHPRTVQIDRYWIAWIVVRVVIAEVDLDSDDAVFGAEIDIGGGKSRSGWLGAIAIVPHFQRLGCFTLRVFAVEDDQ